MKNKEKIGIILTIFCVGLALINRVVACVRFLNSADIQSAVLAMISIVMALLTLWYCVIGYKKPHGNSLKMIYLVFAAYIGHHASVDFAFKGYLVGGYSVLIAALIVAYISGRLDRIEKNKNLLVIAGLLLVVDIVMHSMIKDSFSITRFISLATPFIIFVSICFAYVSRYEKHRAAGQVAR